MADTEKRIRMLKGEIRKRELLDAAEKLFFSKDYWQMYQAQFIGFQYFCFKCYSECPLGEGA